MFSSWVGRVRPLDSVSDVEKGEQCHTSEPSEEIIEIKGDQFADKQEAKQLNLSSIEMYLLALIAALGGHFSHWNDGFSAGFGGFAVALALVATAQYCLVLCIAELSSALPFAGGAYGLARVTLGIYPGYLVACIDTYKSIMYVSSAVFGVGQIISKVTHGARNYEPIYWLAFYVFSIIIHGWGGRTFWRIITGLSAVSLILLLIYLLGAIRFANFDAYAPQNEEDGQSVWFLNGIEGVIHALPRCNWFFVGIQSTNLACGLMLNPKRDVPRAYVGAITTAFLTSFASVFAVASYPPGLFEAKDALRPFTAGFQRIFDIAPDYATIVSLPATIASGFVFLFYFGQQLRAMSLSGLLPAWVATEHPTRKTPIAALILGSAIGYALCVIEHQVAVVRRQFYYIGTLGACCTYLSIYLSFLAFRLHFPTIKREFTSPLGLAGAAYGSLVFALAVVSIVAFQRDQIALYVVLVLIAVASIYYYFVVRTRQIFSEEEKTVMFKAYVVKGNAAKASRIRKGHAGVVAGIVRTAGTGATAAVNMRSSVSADRSVGQTPSGSAKRSGSAVNLAATPVSPTPKTAIELLAYGAGVQDVSHQSGAGSCVSSPVVAGKGPGASMDEAATDPANTTAVLTEGITSISTTSAVSAASMHMEVRQPPIAEEGADRVGIEDDS